MSIFPASKIASLSEKYFSIPAEYLSYYPPTASSISSEVGPAERANLRALEAAGVFKRKRPGRPCAVDKENIVSAPAKKCRSRNKKCEQEMQSGGLSRCHCY